MRAPIVGTAILLGAFSAHAQEVQPDVARPKAAERIARVFDFEEPDNPLPVPQNWVRGQHDPLLPRVRPGFPAWNGAGFSDEVAHGGTRSVVLPTKGGSTSLLLRSGALPVLPGADYRVSAWVCTRGLVHARAFLLVRLLDEAGKPVPRGESRSLPVISEHDWTQTDVAVYAGNAAYMQLELLLLQPSGFIERSVDFPELVSLEDVSGSAWFDDVVVAQLPRTEMSMNSPGNMVRGSERPRLHVEVRDMTGEDLHVVARVLSIDGDEVDRVTFPFGGGRSEFDWEPAIDRLGWYRAVLEITDGRRRVGSDTLDFAWVPGRVEPGTESAAGGSVARGEGGAGSADRERFVVITRQRNPDMLGQLPEVIDRIGAGAVTLPGWWELDTDDPTEQVDQMMPVVRAMRARRQSVAIMLDRLPEKLAGDLGLDRADVLGLFDAGPERYGPVMRPMLDRLGQVVRRWQIGDPFDESLVRHPRASEVLDRIGAEIRRPVPDAELAVPWPIELVERPGLIDGPDRIAILGSSQVLEHHEVAALSETWTGGGGDPSSERSVQLVLRSEDPLEIGYQACAESFARSAIEAWAAIGPRSDSIERRGGSIAVLEPWVWTTHLRPRLMPAPEAAVLANLIEHLADRTASVDIDLGPGVRCVLLEPRAGAPPGRGAAIAVWAEPDALTPRTLDMLLAPDDLIAIDIFGNRSPLARRYTGELEIPSHSVPLGSAPVLVEGVDAPLIRFFNTLRLDPPMVSSRTQEQEHRLLVTNPWPVPIRGELYIVEPGGFSTPDAGIDRSWRINPRVISFALGAGEAQAIPVAIAFSPFEEAGPRGFIFDIDLTADREYATMRVERPVEIGVSGLRMRVSYRLGPGPGGPHVYADADVINTGTKPTTFRLTAQASGFPRGSASITALAPGQTARRTFVFPDAVSRLTGLSVYVSLSVPDSDTRLNRSVLIE